MATFADLIERWSNIDMKQPRASAFFGMIALVADSLQESMVLASRMHLLDDPESPDDVLPFIARDRRLPRYPLETADQHRERLYDAWDIYALGASDTAIEQQLRAAGYGPTADLPEWGEDGQVWGHAHPDGAAWGDAGVYIESMANEPGPRGEPPPYWSQFRVIFQPAFHPVTGPPHPWGDFFWGELYPPKWVWTLAGLTPDHYRTIIGIIRKWKHPEWVCRKLVFTVSEQVWGQDGFVWGQDGFFWGSGFEVTVPLS